MQKCWIEQNYKHFYETTLFFFNSNMRPVLKRIKSQESFIKKIIKRFSHILKIVNNDVQFISLYK